MPKTFNTFFSFFLFTLKATYKENRYFFTCFFIYLFIGGLGLLTLNHGDLLLYFSENRSTFGNTFFKTTNLFGEEWAYVFFLIIFLFIRIRYAVLLPIVGLLVTIVSVLTKSFFQQPRPSVFFKDLGTISDLNLVEGVTLVKGLTSFPSGHTMSAFALFTFVALCFRRKKGLAILLFLSAVGGGVARVYLAQHFLRDIYLGTILGFFIGLLLYSWQRTYPINSERWYDQKIG